MTQRSLRMRLSAIMLCLDQIIASVPYALSVAGGRINLETIRPDSVHGSLMTVRRFSSFHTSPAAVLIECRPPHSRG